jgi:hypothetical protein
MRRRSLTALAALCVVSWGLTVQIGCATKPPAPPSTHEVQEFQDAVNDGDSAIVDRLLSAKPGLVNVLDAQGRTPLGQARARNDDEMVEVLRRHGGKE